MHRYECVDTENPELSKLNSVAFVRKLVSEVSANFGDRGCRVVGATDPHGRNLGLSR
jgi:hypothetical protein